MPLPGAGGPAGHGKVVSLPLQFSPVIRNRPDIALVPRTRGCVGALLLFESRDIGQIQPQGVPTQLKRRVDLPLPERVGCRVEIRATQVPLHANSGAQVDGGISEAGRTGREVERGHGVVILHLLVRRAGPHTFHVGRVDEVQVRAGAEIKRPDADKLGLRRNAGDAQQEESHEPGEPPAGLKTAVLFLAGFGQQLAPFDGNPPKKARSL